jgi:hypothetical protein
LDGIRSSRFEHSQTQRARRVFETLARLSNVPVCYSFTNRAIVDALNATGVLGRRFACIDTSFVVEADDVVLLVLQRDDETLSFLRVEVEIVDFNADINFDN